MAEYINRNAALGIVNGWREQLIPTYGKNDEYVKCLETVAEHLETLPAADVRPVVLCRDCKWCHAGYCEKYDDLIPFGCANKPWEDWFCADGKKKEES